MPERNESVKSLPGVYRRSYWSRYGLPLEINTDKQILNSLQRVHFQYPPVDPGEFLPIQIIKAAAYRPTEYRYFDTVINRW